MTGTAVPETLSPAAEELAALLSTGFCIPREDYQKGLLPAVLGEPGGDPFVRRAGTILKQIETTSSPLMDLSRLVGLGIGFTPGGDDFIAGACAAERLLAAGSRTIDVKALQNGLSRTTTGGATLLRLVLNDAPPAYLSTMGYALLRGDGGTATGIAAGYGNSSGFDALAGIIWRIRMYFNDIIVSPAALRHPK